jgi:hypothetical protein
MKGRSGAPKDLVIGRIERLLTGEGLQAALNRDY